MGCNCNKGAKEETANKYEVRVGSRVIETTQSKGKAQIIAASNPGAEIHPIST